MSAPRTQIGQAEVDKQHRAIVQALDTLFELEVPRGPRPTLRLVYPLLEAIDRDPEDSDEAAHVKRDDAARDS
jgi:hypothetical protein